MPNLFSPKSLVYVSTWEELAAEDEGELWLVTNCHDNEWKQRCLLGGAGMAVSARSRHIGAAVEFVRYVASADVQTTAYAEAGGQPAHGIAWTDPKVNEASSDFYRATLDTLTRSYMRPRHRAFPGFQERAALVLHGALRSGFAGETVRSAWVIERMNALYRRLLSEA